MTRPVALITGASSGLGEVFARKMAARGNDLILVARRVDRLEILASQLDVNVRVIEADLATDKGAASVEAAIAETPTLDLLVNNAGFGTLGRFWEASLDGQDQMHRLHVLTPMRLTHIALAGMIARKHGAVINVSSMAAFTQSAGNVSYCATKAWMNNFTLGLNVELRGIKSPVRVQALCPGFTITEFHDALGVDRGAIPNFLWLKADYVVNASLRGLDRGEIIVVPGWKYKVAVQFMRHLPGSLIRAARPRRDTRV